MVVFDRIFMCRDKLFDANCFSPKIVITFPDISINMTIIISNSEFQNIHQQVLYIRSELFTNEYNSLIKIENCKFTYVKYVSWAMIEIQMSHYNTTLIISNCQFILNPVHLIFVSVIENQWNGISVNTSCILSSKIIITHCDFIRNNGALMRFFGNKLIPSISLEYIYIYVNALDTWDKDYNNNLVLDALVYINNSIVYVNGYFKLIMNTGFVALLVQSSHISFNGLVNISDNLLINVVMRFQSSEVLFNGPLILTNNEQSIMQMSSCNVTFNGSVSIYNSFYCDYIMQFQSCNIIFSKLFI